jgi:hypothetical protein
MTDRVPQNKLPAMRWLNGKYENLANALSPRGA